MPTPPEKNAPKPSVEGDPLSVVVEGLHYSLDRPPSKGARKIVATIALEATADTAPLVDRVDLYSHRSRLALAALVSETFGREVGAVMGALALLLDQVERTTASTTKPTPIILTAARTKAAETLLGKKDLLDRVANAVGDLGYVGEIANKKLLYLIATSRLLPDPLSGVLRAPAGTGKSDLMVKVMALLPEEAIESVTRLTPASLYYLGADHLRNKIVVVDEHVGASEVEHALRVLQSAGKLTLAYVKAGKTETFTVHGPVAVISGTATDDLHEENASRVLELALDDSEAQTKLVLEAQRRAASGERRADVSAQVFQDAQRLLEPVAFVLPFANKLAFPSRSVQARRDQAKLLRLCGAHAVLHGRQRDHDGEGRVVGTVDDYRAIHGLLAPLVSAELDGLSARASALFRALTRREGSAFTRRDAAALMRWGYNTAKRAMAELAAHELLRVVEHGMPRRYEIVDGSLASASFALTDPDEL